MGPFSFRKEERLHKRKEIQELFEKGSSFHLHPFKVLVMRQPPGASMHKVLISVPGRIFRKAVDRNLIKRRIREAYRTQKHKLPKEDKLVLGLVYTASDILPYSAIQGRIMLVFARVEKVLKQKGTSDGIQA